jgi:hypothetical protein
MYGDLDPHSTVSGRVLDHLSDQEGDVSVGPKHPTGSDVQCLEFSEGGESRADLWRRHLVANRQLA